MASEPEACLDFVTLEPDGALMPQTVSVLFTSTSIDPKGLLLTF